MNRYRKKKTPVILIPILIVIIYGIGFGIWVNNAINKEHGGAVVVSNGENPQNFADDSSSGVVVSNLNESKTDKSNDSASSDSSMTSEADTSSEDVSAVETNTEPEEPARSLSIEETIESMTMQEKVMQLFIVTPEQITGVEKATIAGDMTRAALEKYPVGGIIYFAKNIENPQQVKEMIANTKSYCKITPFISVDEEGGLVARLGDNSSMGTTKFPDMGSIQSEDEARNVGKTIGSDLKRYGFNLDFAPVADVNSNPNNTVIGTRSFSPDPETAARLVRACVEGFKESGTLCTLKHFPGHGDTATDSHYGVAQTDKDLMELENCELLPFKAGIEAGTDFVMIGHISAPNITGNDLPATLSYEIITYLLRDRLGFDGVVITDSMLMGAIVDNYSPGIAAVEAIKAGADMILMPQDLDEAVNALINAIDNGEISKERIDESITRILKAKQKI